MMVHTVDDYTYISCITVAQKALLFRPFWHLRQEHASGHETPLYLRATAGMRLLFPDQRESILEPRLSISVVELRAHHVLGLFRV